MLRKRRPKRTGNLRNLAKHPKVVAVGEIGLDYHYDHSPRDVQRDVFAEQMRIASDAGKPIIIHSREAWCDTMALVRQHWNPTYWRRDSLLYRRPREAREALDARIPYQLRGASSRFPKRGTFRKPRAWFLRSTSDRNRRTISRSGAQSRQAQRTGVHGADRSQNGGTARRNRPNEIAATDHREFRTAIFGRYETVTIR